MHCFSIIFVHLKLTCTSIWIDRPHGMTVFTETQTMSYLHLLVCFQPTMTKDQNILTIPDHLTKIKLPKCIFIIIAYCYISLRYMFALDPVLC